MHFENAFLRTAAAGDAAALLEIYAPYVRDTAVSFEYTVPTVEEFFRRIERTLKRYPYLVLQSGECILGYAYASPFKERAAYDWAVETSIYVAQEARGMGLGRRLHTGLEAALRRQGVLNMCACIAVPDGEEDEYLTRDSVRFHDRMGYRMVGEFQRCGYKFGRWYNMVWMEKLIGEHLSDQPPILPPQF